MHIHFEKSINAKCDCSILSMSWMGKVPDELPEEEGWKLNRTHYYQEGWLATGNLRGIVGVSFTSSQWRKNMNNYGNSNNNNAGGAPAVSSFCTDLPQRTNYNLRGHRSQITLVQWNEPYQKLASCDSSGIIFVWIKFEGRWSIELINDRSTPVTHFSWSHDGRMALICYRDGFVLVGSVAGQRYWSSMLNLNAIITCGLWAPDDQHVYLGTSSAQVIVMDVVHGMMISQVQLPMDSPILQMQWSCEKFKMEENEDVIPGNVNESSSSTSSSPGYNINNNNNASSSNDQAQFPKPRPMILAVLFQNGLVFLMKNYDDIAPIQIYTGMQQGLMMEWSNSGEYLALVGSRPVEVINEAGAKIHEYFSSLHFYNHNGVRILNIVIPSTQSPVTALTWGHNDKRLFIATGQTIHTGWVAKRVASLQLLCRLTIYKALSDETCVSHLPLPLPVRTLISSLHTQTILSVLPNEKDLLEFVSHPPYNNVRLHCTMIKHDEIWSQSPGTVYTLYLEYLGGLIPILKGKRISKIRPHFVIYSPQKLADSSTATLTKNDSLQQGNSSKSSTPFQQRRQINNNNDFNNPYHVRHLLLTDSSDSEDVDLCASPRLQRRRHRARLRERERERQRERELEWERSRNNQQQQLQPQNQQNINNSNNNNNNGSAAALAAAAASSTMNLNNLEHFIHPLQPALTHQLVYNDVLPEDTRLVEVTSNIWGTRFKIHGLESFPPNLGSLSYKTSVLHLQPRQMTCIITELTDDIFVNSSSSNPDNNNAQQIHQHNNNNSNSLDEADDMFSVIVGGNGNNPAASNNSYYTPTPIDRSNSIYSRDSPARYSSAKTTTKVPDDEFPYVDIQPLLAELNITEQLQSTPNTLKRQLVTHAALIEATTTTDEPSTSTASSSSCFAVPAVGGGPGPSSILTHRGSVHSSPSKNRRISWTKLHQSPAIVSASGGGNEPTTSRVFGEGAAAAASSPPPVQPIHVRRSISASYLDNVFERTLPVPVDMVSPDVLANPLNSPPKRLVLVKEVKETDEEEPKISTIPPMTLKDCGKSKSWDFADLFQLRQKSTSSNVQQQDEYRPCCPNCKFPTVNKPDSEQVGVGIGQGSGSNSNAIPALWPCTTLTNKFPKTPARKVSIPKTPRRKDSNEDRIERLTESSPSPTPTPPTPSTTSNLTANKSQFPPQTPKLQRRFSNFLTPILRRKDFFTDKKKPTTTTGGNPNSTCFIPPDSPTHIAKPKPMSTPTTPAAKRKFKTGLNSNNNNNNSTKQSSSLATGCSSPFRQFFANSPLLSRRKYNNSSTNSNTSTNSSNTTTAYYRHHQYHPPRVIDSTDDDDDVDDYEYDIEVPSSPSMFSRSRSNSMKASIHHNLGTNAAIPGTQAHHYHHRTTTGGTTASTFRDLESFQKNQLKQKLRKKKIHNIDNSPVRPKRREFILHNKAPMWNENSQVYQLDFGGRVTQESAKNFQIEFRGKQVMQFGRIDGNAYTLDFQYPFSALQAFGVALANITQRLK